MNGPKVADNCDAGNSDPLYFSTLEKATKLWKDLMSFIVVPD